MAEDDRSPEDEFQELIRQLFGGGADGIDPEQLSRLTGMGIDPAMTFPNGSGRPMYVLDERELVNELL